MTAHHTSRVRATALAIANFLIPISILIFATGFFPYKPFLPGLAEYETLEYGPPPEAPFDRLVFMVVDALRSDFVYAEGSGFEFTQDLIRKGHALPFTANARSPTVTMPRIKAITTGSIPSFLDVILNLDEADTSSTLSVQDTWLAQMKAKGTGKMVMYGDDTWLKLFPDTFDRVDGTSSFFVSDFTEVDNNVTRHVPDELENSDWNTMILHYLGLDHIGHKSGPQSANMLPKQQEMDSIVQRIYETIESRDHHSSTLLVLCGDHGMNEAGNHGASSAGETSPALVFVSPRLRSVSPGMQSPVSHREDFRYYRYVEQSDLAPTLGALLGFPVPQNNLGALITDFLPLWSQGSDQTQLLLRNARQILRIVTATFGQDLFESYQDSSACANPQDDAHELACEWQTMERQRHSFTNEDGLDPAWVSAMGKWLEKAQDLLSSMASNYDMSRLVLGQVMALVAFFATSSSVSLKATHAPFVVMVLSYGIMMFASSYVEEEHHFWYWMASAWFAFLAMRQLRFSDKPMLVLLQLFLALTATRLVRGWNQTGQKHAGEPDIVKSFIVTAPSLLWTLVGMTYLVVGSQISRRLVSMPSGVSFLVTAFLVLSAFTFKLAFTHEDSPELAISVLEQVNALLPALSLINRARVVFSGLAATAMYAVCASISNRNKSHQVAELLHSLYTLFAMTQSRVTNIPLFLLFQCQGGFLSSLGLDNPATISTSSLLLQYSSFFAAGGTNAISSVDLSSAYNGVSGFNVMAVGLLTFVSNWAGPIYWTSATNLLLLRARAKSEAKAKAKATETSAESESSCRTWGLFAQHVANLSLFATCSVAFIMAACTALRTHLFIWTVFSPKYLYCMAWNIVQHLVVNTLIAGGLYATAA